MLSTTQAGSREPTEPLMGAAEGRASELAHVMAVCSSSSCGLRFPVPIGDPRHGTCPVCEYPTRDADRFPLPHHQSTPTSGGSGVTVGLLDNIRSALNVGTMLRAADGARVDHMHLCGLTPGGDHRKVAKTSLGAEGSVPWTSHPDATVCAAALAEAGWALWAVESTPASLSLEQVGSVPDQLVVMVGNERAGVDPALLEMADRHVHLPMAGAKTTLNVGVAFGIAVYGVRAIRHRATNRSS